MIARPCTGIWPQLQAAVPGVQIEETSIDDQYVKMVYGKVVLVKQKSCLVRTAVYTTWVPVVMDPVSYDVLPGRRTWQTWGARLSRLWGLTSRTASANAHASVTSPSRVWNRRTSRNVGGRASRWRPCCIVAQVPRSRCMRPSSG